MAVIRSGCLTGLVVVADDPSWRVEANPSRHAPVCRALGCRGRFVALLFAGGQSGILSAMATTPPAPAPSEPVQVDERIPVAGEHDVSPEEVRAEGIPLPANLRLQREIGRGVAGRIHPAIDRNLLRPVALKRLAKELASKQFYRDGFIAEAQMTGQLEHPNIVPVHECPVAALHQTCGYIRGSSALSDGIRE